MIGSVVALAALQVSTVPVTAEEATPLLGYCAPPLVPPCVGALKDHPDQLGACAPQMDAYVATVFRYRVCLTRETDRAVREANGAIAKLRCAQKRGPC